MIAVIGGLYRLEGAWVGAIFFALLDNYSREWTPDIGDVLGPERFNTLIGIVFLVIILVSPGGLMGIWDKGKERLNAPSGVGAPCWTDGVRGAADPGPLEAGGERARQDEPAGAGGRSVPSEGGRRRFRRRNDGTVGRAAPAWGVARRSPGPHAGGHRLRG